MSVTHHLELVLACWTRRIDIKGEKYLIMMKNDIILGHIISKKDIEVDKDKVDLITNLLAP